MFVLLAQQAAEATQDVPRDPTTAESICVALMVIAFFIFLGWMMRDEETADDQ